MRVDDVVDTLFWIVRKNEIRSNPLILMVSEQYPFWMEKIIPFNNIFQWELWYNIHYKLKLNFNNIILTSSMLQFHIPEKLPLKIGIGKKRGVVVGSVVHKLVFFLYSKNISHSFMQLPYNHIYTSLIEPYRRQKVWYISGEE